MEEKINSLKSEILSSKEIRRYSQQITQLGLGINGQEKLKQSRILVIGAGGKGSTILQNLASVGIGVIGICDNYPVTEDQLSRQHLYGNGDLGKQKAIISRQKLMDINHLIDYRLHNVCLSEKNIDLICAEYDILVDATDNYPAHYLINDASIRMKKPVVFGSLDNSEGLVTVFNYKGGPSLRCYYPKPPTKKEIISDDGFVCLVMIINIIGSIMANEAIKLVIGIETELSGNVLTFNAAKYKFILTEIIRNPANFK